MCFVVTWLKFQINFKLRHEKHTHVSDKLHEIEHRIKNVRHPRTRQQYQDNKQQFTTIADDLRQIDAQLQERIRQNANVQSSTCTTPLSAASSGYGSDMN